MENGPGLEDGTIDVERLLVEEPQDGHISMDTVLRFNEKIPQNNMHVEDVPCSFGGSNTGIAREGKDIAHRDVLGAMSGEVEAGYFRLQNDFCSMGEDYLLGVEFAESITNLDYGSIEGLHTSFSDCQILASNAVTVSPWKSELFRIMEGPECKNDQFKVNSTELGDVPSQAEEKSLKPPTSCTSKSSDKFHDISDCSLQDILSDENDASRSASGESPNTEKHDEFGMTGQDCVMKKFEGQGALATTSAQASLTSALPVQKRLRKPTQRYIDELADPISRTSKRRREVSSSTCKDKSLGVRVKDQKKYHTGSRAMGLPDEESSVKAIQVPFGSLVHNECPKSHTDDLVQRSDRGMITKSKDRRNTPDKQKKRDECIHLKEKDDFVPAASQKKRVDSVTIVHLMKRNDRITDTSQKTTDDWIISASPKKREQRVIAVSQKKKNNKKDEHLDTDSPYEFAGGSPKKREHRVISASQKKKDDKNDEYLDMDSPYEVSGASPKKREHRVVAANQKKKADKKDECLDSDSPYEVAGKRKHHRLWTIAEVRKLIDGVSHYGVGRWSRIKKLFFSASAHRTSVDLKDKWRNLLKASGIKEQNSRQGEKKRSIAWRPLPKPILRRVCELATMHPYPKGRPKIGRVRHDSPDRSTDITLSDYRRILRSINDN